VERRPCGGILVDLVICELFAVGDVFSADFVVHVGLDTTWSNAVDGDFLVAEVCFVLVDDVIGRKG
jgi:hypothetical protein